MDKSGNGSSNKTVTDGDGYSAKELAQFKLPGYPISRKGWYDRARRENWKIREEPGKGPGGMRQIFIPPPEIGALIEARQRGDIPHSEADTYLVKQPVAASGSVKAVTISPSNEWLVRVAMFANEAEWLRNVDQDRKVGLVLDAFKLTLLLSEGDESRFALLTGKPNAIMSALRLAYEIDCANRGLTPSEDS